MPRCAWLIPVLLVACAKPLALPEAPNHAPQVESLEPRAAFAGDTLTLTGSGFGADASDLRVEFPGALPVAAREVTDGRLTVQVPLDAGNGPVAVSTSRGRGVSPESTPFEMKGRGTLVNPSVATTADLRPRLQTALEVDGELLVMAGPPYRRAAIREGVFTPLPGDALWIGAHGNEVVELVSTADEANCGADLVFLDPEPPVKERARVTLTDTGDHCSNPDRLLVAGDRVFVRAGNGLFVVNAADASATRLPAPEGSAGLTPALARVDDTRVLAASEGGVWDVRLTSEGWSVNVVPTPVPLVAIALSNGRALGLSDDGQLVRLTVGEDAIEVGTPEPLAALEGESAGRIALSEDGERLAVSSPKREHVYVYAVTGSEAVALTSVAIEEPQDVRSASGGRWLVAAEGGTVTLSDRTGNVVDSTDVGSRPLPPTLRVATLEDGNPRPWLEIVSTAFNRLRRFDPDTLVEEVYYIAPLDPGPPVSETACAKAGSDLVLQHGRRELRRIGDDEFPAESYHHPFLAPESWSEITSLRMAEDGRDALVLHADTDGTTRLTLLPLDAAWDAFTPNAFDPGITEISSVFAEGSRLAVVGASGIALFDRDAAREGRVVPFGEGFRWPDEFAVVGAGLFDGRLGVLTASGPMGYWRSFQTISLTTGEAPPMPEPYIPQRSWDGNVTLSPSGRSFWWRSAETDETVLGEGTFDAKGLPVFQRAAVRLSAGADTIVADPRGEKLWVLDPANDRLQLVR